MRIDSPLVTPALQVMWKLTLSSVAALASACALGPNYQRPALPQSATWSPEATRAFDPALPSRSVEKADDSTAWWVAFGDSTLDKLIETATAENLDLKQAILRIGEARLQRDSTASALLPTVSSSALAARTRLGNISQSISPNSGGATSGGSPPAWINLFEVGFDATWELDLFGKTRRSVEAANDEILSTEASAQDSRLTICAEIARTYFSLRGYQKKRDLYLADVADQEHLGRLVASRQSVGLAAIADVAAQETQTSTTKATLPQLEQGIAQSKNQIALLLALPPGAVAEILDEAPLPALPVQVPIDLPSVLLTRRADVREHEAELAAATARIGVAKASFFPQITLGLTGGLLSTKSSKLFDWSSRFGAGGAQVTLPIFEGGNLVAQYKLADLKAQEAALAYRASVLNAFHEVDNALIAYAADQRHETGIGQQLAAARRGARLSLERYNSGLSAYVEVLNSQHQVLQSEQSEADAGVTSRTDLVALYKALGGGWQTASEPLAKAAVVY